MILFTNVFHIEKTPYFSLKLYLYHHLGTTIITDTTTITIDTIIAVVTSIHPNGRSRRKSVFLSAHSNHHPHCHYALRIHLHGYSQPMSTTSPATPAHHTSTITPPALQYTIQLTTHRLLCPGVDVNITSKAASDRRKREIIAAGWQWEKHVGKARKHSPFRT